MISWHSSTLPALDLWLQEFGPNRSVKGLGKRLGCRPIDSSMAECLKRLDEAKLQGNPIVEPLMVSVVHEAVGRIMAGDETSRRRPERG